MDVENPRFEEWEARFLEVAQHAQKIDRAPDIARSKHYLCLYGENGMNPDQEFAELEEMAEHPERLKKVEVDSAYWQDTVLFIP